MQAPPLHWLAWSQAAWNLQVASVSSLLVSHLCLTGPSFQSALSCSHAVGLLFPRILGCSPLPTSTQPKFLVPQYGISKDSVLAGLPHKPWPGFQRLPRTKACWGPGGTWDPQPTPDPGWNSASSGWGLRLGFCYRGAWLSKCREEMLRKPQKCPSSLL